ncbi:MAG: hypothetical protein ABIH41_05630 [Nanoarchaeota archaeon]
MAENHVSINSAFRSFIAHPFASRLLHEFVGIPVRTINRWKNGFPRLGGERGIKISMFLQAAGFEHAESALLTLDQRFVSELVAFTDLTPAVLAATLGYKAPKQLYAILNGRCMSQERAFHLVDLHASLYADVIAPKRRAIKQAVEDALQAEDIANTGGHGSPQSA